MNKRDILECNDINVLKKMCLMYREQEAYIQEVLIDETKWHITAENATDMIRGYFVDHQYDMDKLLTDKELNTFPLNVPEL